MSNNKLKHQLILSRSKQTIMHVTSLWNRITIKNTILQAW